jgi:hypothetical protein
MKDANILLDASACSGHSDNVALGTAHHGLGSFRRGRLRVPYTQQSTVFGRRAAATKINPHSSSGSALVHGKLVRRSQLAHAEALCLVPSRTAHKVFKCNSLSRRAAAETLGQRRGTVHSLVKHIILHTDEDDTNTVGYDTRRDKGDTGEDESDIHEKAKEPRETTNTPPRSRTLAQDMVAGQRNES